MHEVHMEVKVSWWVMEKGAYLRTGHAKFILDCFEAIVAHGLQHREVLSSEVSHRQQVALHRHGQTVKCLNVPLVKLPILIKNELVRFEHIEVNFFLTFEDVINPLVEGGVVHLVDEFGLGYCLIEFSRLTNEIPLISRVFINKILIRGINQLDLNLGHFLWHLDPNFVINLILEVDVS